MFNRAMVAQKWREIMQNGTIARVEPIIGQNGPAGYQGRNGWIYIFNIAIDTPTGQVTGEIGSKSQVYPLQAGSTISFIVENSPHGVKIRRKDPQYAQQDAQPAPQAHNAPHDHNNYQGSQAPPRDTQDDIRWAQAVNVAFAMFNTDKITDQQIKQTHAEIYDLLKLRKFASWMCPQSFDQFAAGANAEEQIPPDPNDY